MFLSTLRTFDLALFVFGEAKDKFKGLLAIIAIKFITRHKHLRTRSEKWTSPTITLVERRCQDRVGL
jgi:hypothetical protein